MVTENDQDKKFFTKSIITLVIQYGGHELTHIIAQRRKHDISRTSYQNKINNIILKSLQLGLLCETL